jgi:ATP-dependent RNA helicase DDX27
MALKKRKAQEDDFYYTMSDEEEPPRKKQATNGDDTSESEGEEQQGASDNGFQLLDFDDGFGGEDPEENLLQWTQKKKAVDLDEIIRKRAAKGGEDGASEDNEPSDGLDLDDDDDEVLAEDAFGMGADMDVDESEAGDGESGDDKDEIGSDDSDDAEPVGHPDDDDEVSESSVDEDEGMDELEQARQRAFFAPEPKGNAAQVSTATFASLHLSRPILTGVTAAGFEKPTQIQAQTIPFALEGKDVVAQAVTGSGKTAAFLLPILERLFYGRTRVPVTRVVILTPTRELAIQCHTVGLKLARKTGVTMALAVGGTSFSASEKELRLRPDIVIATPGRFIDHMRNSQFAIDSVEMLVLDEADRMLMDGFADELNEIVTTLPKRRQTMLFSATMNSSVDQLIRVGLTKPVRILADSDKKSVRTLVQEFVRLRPGREEKRMGYLLHLCQAIFTQRVIIFFAEKRIIHRTRIIFGLLGLSCVELHGDIKQSERVESLEAFRSGAVPFLLASDLASRGLDIKGVETVINYDMPKTPEDYIHRIGRTARAGRRGVSVTIVTEKDRKFVKRVAAQMKGTTKLRSRTVDAASADVWQEKVDALKEDIKEVLKEEQDAKYMAQVDREITKGQNLIEHHDEIMSKPKKTWFEKAPKSSNGAESKQDRMQKLRTKLQNKNLEGGKLSNKSKKRLDNYNERISGQPVKPSSLAKKEFKAKMSQPKKGKKSSKGRSKGKPSKGKR